MKKNVILLGLGVLSLVACKRDGGSEKQVSLKSNFEDKVYSYNRVIVKDGAGRGNTTIVYNNDCRKNSRISFWSDNAGEEKRVSLETCSSTTDSFYWTLNEKEKTILCKYDDEDILYKILYSDSNHLKLSLEGYYDEDDIKDEIIYDLLLTKE